MKNTKKGFTLVELLVVIAILAILASVSVVGYTAFIKKAEASKMDTEIKQIQMSIEAEMMVSDNIKVAEGIFLVKVSNVWHVTNVEPAKYADLSENFTGLSVVENNVLYNEYTEKFVVEGVAHATGTPTCFEGVTCGCGHIVAEATGMHTFDDPSDNECNTEGCTATNPDYVAP